MTAGSGSVRFKRWTSAYIAWRQYMRPRRAPRTFYTLEWCSLLALGWWVHTWPWSSDAIVPLAFIAGCWVAIRSEWPLQPQAKRHAAGKAMASLAAWVGFEFARDLRHHHRELEDETTKSSL